MGSQLIDYYSYEGFKEYKIDPQMSVREIQQNLLALRRLWNQRENRNPEKARVVLSVLDSAKKYFANEQAKAEYDRALEQQRRDADQDKQRNYSGDDSNEEKGDFVDYYSEDLGISRTMSAQDILSRLNRLGDQLRSRGTFNSAVYRKLNLIDKGQVVFQSEQSKQAYDAELDRRNRKAPQKNTEQERKARLYDGILRAREFLANGFPGEASAAAESAMRFYDEAKDGAEIYLLFLDISKAQGKADQAVRYLQRAVVADPRNPSVYARGALLYSSLLQDANQCRKYASKMIELANGSSDRDYASIGNGLLAWSYYFQDPKDMAKGLSLANACVSRDAWGNAKKVLEAEKERAEFERKWLESERKREEAERRARQERENAENERKSKFQEIYDQAVTQLSKIQSSSDSTTRYFCVIDAGHTADAARVYYNARIDGPCLHVLQFFVHTTFWYHTKEDSDLSIANEHERQAKCFNVPNGNDPDSYAKLANMLIKASPALNVFSTDRHEYFLCGLCQFFAEKTISCAEANNDSKYLSIGYGLLAWSYYNQYDANESKAAELATKAQNLLQGGDPWKNAENVLRALKEREIEREREQRRKNREKITHSGCFWVFIVFAVIISCLFMLGKWIESWTSPQENRSKQSRHNDSSYASTVSGGESSFSMPQSQDINNDYGDSKYHEALYLATLLHHLPIATGYNRTVGIRSDYTVVATGLNDHGECDVSKWNDVVAVASGDHHTIGLKKDGTVVATGRDDQKQCSVNNWTNIVAISAGGNHSVGLREDGTVVATGDNANGECNVGGWSDIIAIDAGDYHTVGLKRDGTVVAVGTSIESDGQCDVQGWKDIIAISAGYKHTIGVKQDGTVISAGLNNYGQCNVSSWNHVIAVSAGGFHTVAQKDDGSFIATGSNNAGQCNVSNWHDIITFAAGDTHTVGLKEDGTIVGTGTQDDGQLSLNTWRGMLVMF